MVRLRITVRGRGRVTGGGSPHGLDHGRVRGRRCTARVGDRRAASLCRPVTTLTVGVSLYVAAATAMAVTAADTDFLHTD